MDNPQPGRTPPPPAALPRVLVVDDEDALRSIFRRTLEREGFEVAEASDGGQAVERFRGYAPAVTVLDVALPDRDGISVLAELRELDPAAVIIIVTGQGDVETALRAGAASFLRKPLRLADLAREVRHLVAWRSQVAAGAPAARGAIHLSLGTTEARELAAVGELTLPLLGLLDEAEVLGVRIGVAEMIANAVEHGNLGISASEKEAALADGRFDHLVASRLAMPENAAKRVWIESRVSDGEFRVAVRDEGAGFDWRALAAAEPGATLAGRGVLLAGFHFDEVRWNEPGNEVTLVKRLPRLG